MDVPTKPGIGVEVNMKMLEKVTFKKQKFENKTVETGLALSELYLSYIK
jgi:hypothetical protein